MDSVQFADLGISSNILKAVNEMGFEAPTKIQAAAIPLILQGKDIAGQAQTGTGKTAAFAIPVLDRIDRESKQVQALVLCPTRELAVQVTEEFIRLSRHMDHIFITPVYGGQSIQQQFKQLKKGTQVVVGTPGRIIDHLKRGTLILDALRMVILDEADEMLNMGFREDIETILGYSKEQEKAQAIMFSATISPGIKKIMQRWFHNAEMIRVEGQSATADGVEQYLLEVRDSMRTDAICRILDIYDYRLSLVFCNTKRKCDSLVSEMQSRGYSSDVLHGDLSQNIRDKVMNRFRKGMIDVLIATDVAARGIDVDNIDAVFNYDIPQDPEYYVHRIGRTGRAGKKGAAYTFTAGRKSKSIRYIEQQIKMKLTPMQMPSIKQVETARRDTILDEVLKTLQSGGLRPYIEQIEALSATDFTPIEVAAALLKLQSGPEVTEKEIVREKETFTSDSPRPRSNHSKKRTSRKKNKSRKNEPFYKEYTSNKRGRKKK